MTDEFFSKTKCDRCPNDLKTRTMSWFNDDTICLACSAEESKIKKALREKGIEDAMEGCGFIPNPEEM